MSRFLSRENLARWLDGPIGEGVPVVAPVPVDGVLLFRPLSRAAEMDLDSPGTVLSAKDWFFPPSETLFTVARRDGRVSLEETPVPEKAVLVGLRPCDALGLALMDMPFLAPPTDTRYRQRRENTLLVGVACTVARPECFCTSMGSAPDDPRHLDVMLTPVEGGYLVKAVTERGEKLLAGAGLEERDTSAPPSPTPQKLPTEELSRVARGLFDHPYWGQVADRCIHCNLCAYVCPVCYCFDIRDYSQGNGAERVRSWESCQASGFTRLAGGHEPRPTKTAKLRQRFYHKFLYFPLAFGPLSCTGCGRCVRACPVNIDIREIIQDLQRIGAQVVESGERRG